MQNPEVETTESLVARVADFQARMRAARITEAELKTFQKVAAIMDVGHGQIAGDDLIAASFLSEADQ
ncbi:hypothetical protein [Mesorhizobium loti]|uniref:Uncharacterized protein n=1 Tax=Rhizobium loti TaxID=381 RepID=A0A6M7UB60_RHILI|nr:hypothetical protein [Mesorhizobium loti]OBQ73105.1 hypothetical protein A8145_06280 [Mesorhizobium loti]QKC73956.1 hypothetical protein EB815_24670 [Mesorhizobium loti]